MTYDLQWNGDGMNWQERQWIHPFYNMMEWYGIGGKKYHTIITRLMDWFGIGGKTSHHYHRTDWWTGHGCIRKGVVEVRFMGWIDMEHQATQPAVLSTGCKRCRATAKKNDEQKAKELEAKPQKHLAVNWLLPWVLYPELKKHQYHHPNH